MNSVVRTMAVQTSLRATQFTMWTIVAVLALAGGGAAARGAR